MKYRYNNHGCIVYFYDDYKNPKKILLNDEQYYIKMDSDDYKVEPHFHLISPSINCNIAICLFEPVYLQHERVTQILSDDVSKALDYFLRSKYEGIFKKVETSSQKESIYNTNWDFIVDFMWNSVQCFPYTENKFGKYIESKPDQPDYTKLSCNSIKKRSLYQCIISKCNA